MTLRDLLRRGVSIEAIASSWALRFEPVLFDNGRFTPNVLGDDAVIFGILDGGLIDEAAWNPVTDRTATRYSIGYALGQGQLGRDGLGTTGRALPVRRTPLHWLRAGRSGICIVDFDLAARVLAGVSLEAADDNHARELRRRLKLSPPTIVTARRRIAA